MRKDVILRSVAPLKDDIFEGVVVTCYRIDEPQCTSPYGLYIGRKIVVCYASNSVGVKPW
jgi:hypothetical protein